MATHPHEVTTVLDSVDPSRNVRAGELFDGDALSALRARPGIQDELLEIARDRAEPLARRQAAVEALAQGGWLHARAVGVDSELIAGILADSLARDSRHEHWGLPGNYVGRSGRIALSLPEGVPAAFAKLLGDQRLLEIRGSETATIQHLARYRVADLSAYLLCEYLHVPWVDGASAAERDVEIERLKKSLAER